MAVRPAAGRPPLYLKPIAIAATYAALGILWIFVSDRFVQLALPLDVAEMTWVQSAKGVGFVLFTALILYLLVAAATRQIRRWQAELAASEQLFADLVESVEDYGIFMLDEAGRITTWNRGAGRITGYPPAEAIGQTMALLYDPEERAQGRPEALVRAAAQAGRSEEQGWRRSRTGAFLGHVSLTAAHGSDGAVRGFAAVMRDRTRQDRAELALRESERRFQTLADNIPILLYMLDKDGACSFVNKTWVDYAGVPFETLLADDWQSLVHPEDRLPPIPAPAVANGHQPFVREYRLRRKDGSYRSFLDMTMPHFAPDGRLVGHVGALIDIEDRRRLEQELRQAMKMEAIGLLTGGVAHDFNNLLTVIMGNLEMLSDRAEPDDWRIPHLTVAVEATVRSAALTHQLLAFSRQQMLQPQDVDINAQIGRTISMLRRVLGERITVECRLDPGLWPAFADPTQVESALVNLAVNSRDAMPNGGRLTIETRNVPAAAETDGLKPGDYVLVAVTDTGTGMPPDILERALQPFFTTKDIGKGSGLGLSTIHGFAEQSGGRLVLQSEVGVGTQASLYLPRATGGGAAVAARGEAPVALPRGSETVLVVEDDASVRDTVVHQLRDLGYRTLEAGDAVEALEVLSRTAGIDLLLTDIVMPRGVSGFDLADHARAAHPGLKILFTSGYSEHAVGRRDAYPFLRKPYPRRELASKVREALDTAVWTPAEGVAPS